MSRRPLEAIIAEMREVGRETSGGASRKLVAEWVDELAALEASATPPCVCSVDDGLVQEWVSKARAVAKVKGYAVGASATPRPEGAELTEDEQVSRVTEAVREADAGFQKTGGGSRHWVRDWFLPMLAKHGLAVVASRPPGAGEQA